MVPKTYEAKVLGAPLKPRPAAAAQVAGCHGDDRCLLLWAACSRQPSSSAPCWANSRAAQRTRFGPTVYVVIGMGAFLAATTHAPLMSFLIVFEMPLEYQLEPALMLACLAAYHVSRAIRPHSIYYEVLHRGRGRSLSSTN